MHLSGDFKSSHVSVASNQGVFFNNHQQQQQQQSNGNNNMNSNNGGGGGAPGGGPPKASGPVSQGMVVSQRIRRRCWSLPVY